MPAICYWLSTYHVSRVGLLPLYMYIVPALGDDAMIKVFLHLSIFRSYKPQCYFECIIIKPVETDT